MKNIKEYTPYKGFEDLRECNIQKNEFKTLCKAQSYLYQCEQNRLKGLYKDMPNELDKIKELSAEYQFLLSKSG